jgi:hypothetical protein
LYVDTAAVPAVPKRVFQVQGVGAGCKADFLRDGCAVRVGKTPFNGGDKMVYIPQDLTPPAFARES